MKRNILFPTDFSDNSWSAIGYALKLYEEEECTFFFLNSTALKVSTLSNLSNKLLETMKDEALKELIQIKSLVENNFTNANHNFQIQLSTKNLTEAIKKAIKDWNIDMIVMGTKGASGAKEIFFGSNTINVIKHIKDCPVLIVPEGFNFIKPLQIAFPTDYNRFYSINEIIPLMQLANLYNSKIRIVHINVEEELNEVQEYNLFELQNYLIDYEFSFHWMPKYAKKVVEINDFIEELGIDILTMINYKHGFIEKIIKEPVINKIGFHPKIPFLVIPE